MPLVQTITGRPVSAGGFPFLNRTFAISRSAIWSQVHVPSLDETFPGKVSPIIGTKSLETTRTMYTEVDVPNRTRETLMPGLYAEATLSLERKSDALALPLQAVRPAGRTERCSM